MAENLIISVQENGALKAARNIDQIGKKGRSSAGGVNILNSALRALGGALAIRQVVAYSDAYTQLQNRLKLVTTGTSNLSAVTQELLKVANETRSGFALTAELFARVGLSARELGVSQADVVQVTRTMNQAVILSGATSVEASKGIIQFAQGLASGTLRGDELRAVLEQLPLVADIIAKELGVTRGELRELGAQGKITAKEIISAMKNSAEEVEAAFADTVPTVAQSFEQLKNSVIIFIGEANKARGVGFAISKALKGVAENLDLVARALTSTLLVKGLQNLIRSMAQMVVFAAANPYAVLAAGLTLLVIGLGTFADKIKFGEAGFATLQDVGTAALAALTKRFKTFQEDWLDGVNQIIDNVNDISFSEVVLRLASMADNMIGIFNGLVLAAREVGKALLQNLAITALLASGPSGVGLVTGQITAAVSKFRDQGMSFGMALEAGILEVMGTTPGAVKDAFLTGLDETNIEDALRKFISEGEIAAAARARAAAKEQGELGALPAGTGARPGLRLIQEALGALSKEGELLKLTNNERAIEVRLNKEIDALRQKRVNEEIIAEFKDQFLAQIRLNAQLKIQADLYEEIVGPAQGLEIRLEALNILFDEGRISLEQYNKALLDIRIQQLELTNEMQAGLVQEIQTLIEEFGTVENAALNVATQGVDVLIASFDALAAGGDPFDTLREGLANLLVSLGNAILKMLLLTAVARAFGIDPSLLFGGAGAARGGGGRVTPPPNVPRGPARQHGGPVTAGTPTLVGEVGPELFVPPSAGSIIPNNQLQGSAEPAKVTVINLTDPADLNAALSSREGEQIILNTVRRNRRAVKNSLG